MQRPSSPRRPHSCPAWPVLALCGWGAEHQARGRAGMACVPGASGLKNQVLGALGLPEPTEHPLSHTCSVCHVQALGWGQCHKSPFRAVQGAGRVTQALSG